VTVLYLDVAGAFPNAIKAQLLHNLRKRGVPEEYVLFVDRMLTSRKTCLKFDDYISELINIDNKIGQGDPLSMLLYLFYNADLFDLARNSKEDATGYADDFSLLATGKSFSVCHRKIAKIMSRQGGATEWSLHHNSPWELSKSVYVDYTRDKKMKRPVFQIKGTKIKRVTAHKQVGVFLDKGLRWHEQETHTIAKVTKWTNRIGGFSKTTKGMPAKFIRRLYQPVSHTTDDICR